MKKCALDTRDLQYLAPYPHLTSLPHPPPLNPPIMLILALSADWPCVMLSTHTHAASLNPLSIETAVGLDKPKLT